MKPVRLTDLLLASLLCLPAAAAAAQRVPAGPDSPPPAPANQTYPIQAELVSSLSAQKLKLGDRVVAKLAHEWVLDACTMPRGSARGWQ